MTKKVYLIDDDELEMLQEEYDKDQNFDEKSIETQNTYDYV